MLGTITAFLFAIASADVAEPISAINVITLETRAQARKRKLRERRVWAPQCRKVYSGRDTLVQTIEVQRLYPEKLTQLADRFDRGANGCRKKPDFATLLRDQAAGFGPVPKSSRDEVLTLVDRLKSKSEKADRATALLRGLWLRGDSFEGVDRDLKWTAQERGAFLDRDDVWAWLNVNSGMNYATETRLLERLFAPTSTRYNPKRAIDLALTPSVRGINAEFQIASAKMLIEGKTVPQDIPRAEAALLKLLDYHDSARLMLTELVGPRLASPDTSKRDAALRILTMIASSPTYYSVGKGKEAAQRLLASYYLPGISDPDPVKAQIALFALTSLAESKAPGDYYSVMAALEKRLGSKSIDERLNALTMLGRLSRAGYPQATMLFERGIKQIDQLVVIDNPDEIISNVRTFLSPYDYPPSAVRNEETGVVSGKILIGPDGKALYTYITTSASAALNATVERTALRRIRVRDPKYAGKYIMLKLPDIQFVLGECIADQKPPEAKPGVVQIASEYCPQRVVETPTIVTVIGS